MAIINKKYTYSESVNFIVNVCMSNDAIRIRLINLLNLPFADRKLILEEWMESLRKQAVAESLLKSLEVLFDEDAAAELLKELTDAE